MTARFAPTASGRAHPGTLLAALLCWLDARSRHERLLLRIEDLDPERCRREHGEGLIADLAWFGLDWDDIVWQSGSAGAHAAALDRLAALGRLYPSALSRRELAALGRRAPDGGWAYDNRERDRPLPPGGWRSCREALRCRLDAGCIAPFDEGGLDLAQDPASICGDPLVRRRDGAVSYQLAVVVDDAAAGITRVVRGRDIAPGTAGQVALQRLLGAPTPAYRHHFLLWERGAAEKLSKCHGAIGGDALRRLHAPAELCGILAHIAGLVPAPAPCMPRELLPGFSWQRVRVADAAIAIAPDGLRSLDALLSGAPSGAG